MNVFKQKEFTQKDFRDLMNLGKHVVISLGVPEIELLLNLVNAGLQVRGIIYEKTVLNRIVTSLFQKLIGSQSSELDEEKSSLMPTNN